MLGVGETPQEEQGVRGWRVGEERRGEGSVRRGTVCAQLCEERQGEEDREGEEIESEGDWRALNVLVRGES